MNGPAPRPDNAMPPQDGDCSPWSDALTLDEELALAEADVEAGRFATHQEVVAWLMRWDEPGLGPPPRPWLTGQEADSQA